METFTNFYFWWCAAFMVIQALAILVTEYPKTRTKTVGEDLFSFILLAFFFVWLLFIRLGVVQ